MFEEKKKQLIITFVGVRFDYAYNTQHKFIFTNKSKRYKPERLLLINTICWIHEPIILLIYTLIRTTWLSIRLISLSRINFVSSYAISIFTIS